MTIQSTLSLGEIKKRLQNHLKDDLAIIIGSGLSCAEGLPGMNDLAKHLSEVIPPHLSESDKILWDSIAPQLVTLGLEQALSGSFSYTLEKKILNSISSYLIDYEECVINEVLLGDRVLRLTKLLRHILFDKYIPIITTNYDRLIEVAVEEAGYGVDTFFVGKFIACLDSQKSKLSFCNAIKPPRKGRHATLEYQRRAIICKPHGSLDWYIRGNKPISFCAHATNLDRLIIVPGRNKLEAGYNSPFDFHREKANYHIDNASRFLIIGYGFNDAHLETHLKKAIEGGKSTIMLTHTLSENALNIAFNNSNVIAIDHYCDEHTEGSRFIIDKADYNFPGMQIWDLGNFITEVLEA